MPIPTPLPDADADAATGTDELATRLPDALDDYASLHAEDAAGLGLLTRSTSTRRVSPRCCRCRWRNSAR